MRAGCRRLDLSPAAAVARFPVLMPDDQDSCPSLVASVNNCVRKDLHRKGSSSPGHRRAEPGLFNQKLCNTLELIEKALGDGGARVFAVEIQRVCNVLLSSRVKRVGHRASLARSRAMASCPGTAATAPASSSASRRSASCSQACSTSGSESRLTIRRSSRCERSAGASFRNSASRTSRFVLTKVSREVDDSEAIACHNKQRKSLWRGRFAGPAHLLAPAYCATPTPGKATYADNALCNRSRIKTANALSATTTTLSPCRRMSIANSVGSLYGTSSS
jgi:hypothetical protein